MSSTPTFSAASNNATTRKKLIKEISEMINNYIITKGTKAAKLAVEMNLPRWYMPYLTTGIQAGFSVRSITAINKFFYTDYPVDLFDKCGRRFEGPKNSMPRGVPDWIKASGAPKEIWKYLQAEAYVDEKNAKEMAKVCQTYEDIREYRKRKRGC